MKVWSIWMEGYCATGQSSGAQLLGMQVGDTFDDAVRQYIRDTKNRDKIEEYERGDFVSEEAYKNRRSNWKVWGCALFSSEHEARKSFG